MSEHEHVTTNAVVAAYQASFEVFAGVFSEMRELSKKKPDTTLNKRKVAIINRVLGDLLEFLRGEPEGKYLDLLDDEDLPQNSDAVLVMVQYEKALISFKRRYQGVVGGERGWVTEERLRDWRAIVEE